MPPKVYAVKDGGEHRIYTNWPECYQAVHGKSGVVYKSFTSRQLAETWLESTSINPEPISTKAIKVYVDGSWSPARAEAGWAWIAVKEGKEIARANGVTDGPALSRNIDGELMAALDAMHWVAQIDEPAILYHDYEGIARWALGEWQAKSMIAKQYVQHCKTLLHKISFAKVKAHSGDEWNEKVDALAKQALQPERPLT